MHHCRMKFAALDPQNGYCRESFCIARRESRQNGNLGRTPRETALRRDAAFKGPDFVGCCNRACKVFRGSIRRAPKKSRAGPIFGISFSGLSASVVRRPKFRDR